MDKKLIRIIPPVTAAVITLLDIEAIVLFVFSIKSVMYRSNFWSVALFVIATANIIIAFLTTVKSAGNGVIFAKNTVQFTGLDDNNVFLYKSIVKFETHKDTKASLKKRFVDRYSSIIFYLDDDSVVTVELGYTTKRTLKTIEDELKNRI